jgi:hypothetical protein
VRVDAATGRVEAVGTPGYSPTVSEDGVLAFVRATSDDPERVPPACGEGRAFAVRDGAVDTTHAVPDGLDVASIDWLSTGTVLAHVISPEVDEAGQRSTTFQELVLGDPVHSVGGFDLEPGSIADTSLGEVVTIAGTADWEHVQFDHAVAHQPGVDPDAGIALGEWVTVDFQYPADQMPLTVDADGDPGSILLVTQDPSEIWPPTTTLWLWTGGAEPRALGGGILAAAWGGAPSTEGGPPTDTELPAPVVAIDEDGLLVRLDPEDGETALTSIPFITDAQLSVTADGTRGYVSGPEGDGSTCQGRIMRAELDGADPNPTTVIEGGLEGAVSPDGTKLAYVALEPRTGDVPIPACQQALVVRDLETGEERAWRDEGVPGGEGPGPYAAARTLRWSPGGESLAFQWSYEGDLPYVLRLDDGGGCAWTGQVQACGDVLEGYPVETPDGPGDHWSLVGWDDDGLVVRSQCSVPDCTDVHEIRRVVAPPIVGDTAPDTQAADTPARDTPAGGAIVGTLPPGATEVVWDPELGVLFTQVDSTGRSRLWWIPADESDPAPVADLRRALWLP